jgi:glycosyltransferase involved in cell wall biosynthesis
MNPHHDPAAPRIALLLQDAADGGVERCIVNLASGFVARGMAVDVLNQASTGAYFGTLDKRVRVVGLPRGGGNQREKSVIAYLDEVRPNILLAAKDADCELARGAASGAAHPVRLYLTVSVNVSAQLDGRGAGPVKRWRRYRDVKRIYAGASNLICVSAGVADDMAKILRRDRSLFHVLPNPVVTPEHGKLAREPVDHPWFGPGKPPVVLGVGRLGRIKNFPLLVKAFARVLPSHDCRLVILGEGKHRARLLALARKLGVDHAMDLPGFVHNPIAYMARADLFVLSSRWEGFGNVLVEALACGTPAVSTDCPSGPSEILQNGRYGPLVPVDDEVALAEAMLECLAHPMDAEFLRGAAAPYTLERSCDAYLRAFGLA